MALFVPGLKVEKMQDMSKIAGLLKKAINQQNNQLKNAMPRRN